MNQTDGQQIQVESPENWKIAYVKLQKYENTKIQKYK